MRQVIHVKPTIAGWQLVPEEGGNEPSTHRSIEEAVHAARTALKTSGAGRIVIHNPDGSVEEEYS